MRPYLCGVTTAYTMTVENLKKKNTRVISRVIKGYPMAVENLKKIPE